MGKSAAAAGVLVELGRRVRARRQERRLTLRELARVAGLSERFLGQVESGQANISVGNLAEVAGALAHPLAAFFEGLSAGRAPAHGVIALLGLRGAGKSSVGVRLAKRLGTSFHELDGLVEQEAGMKLSELFAIHGEAYFRQAELKALKRYLDTHPRGVLATGGGLVTDEEAYALVRSRAHTVWLKAAPEEHWGRVVKQGDLRPMRDRPHAMAELKRRLKEREPQWARADLVCATSRRSVEEVVEELARWAGGA